METDRLIKVIKRYAAKATEQDNVEFKTNNSDPFTLAKNISSIANTLILNHKHRGYVVWGIDDKFDESIGAHAILGTNYDPATQKKGNEELLLWLQHSVYPCPNFQFYEVLIDGRRVIVLMIENLERQLVKFQNEAYIRIGANTCRLSDFPDVEKRVWKMITTTNFETTVAKVDLFPEEVTELLDLEAFYELRKNNVPVEKDTIFAELENCGAIRSNSDGTYNIMNLGAILFARRLSDFGGLATHAVRIVTYDGPTKIKTISEKMGKRGYAVDFQSLFEYIISKLPTEEVVEGGLRKTRCVYSELAVRELFANAIVHQDFSVLGMQPIVSIFSDRIEFTNPGKPLVDVRRFIDHPPCSRNKILADEMSRIGICEQRGSGWDKIAYGVENFGISVAPKVEVSQNFTRVVMQGVQRFDQFTKEELIWSTYIHACLNKETQRDTTNASVRARFGIAENDKYIASRLIKQAIDCGLLVVFDDKSGTKNRKYLPFWAKR